MDQVVGWVGYFHPHPSSSLVETHALQATMWILCIKDSICTNRVSLEVLCKETRLCEFFYGSKKDDIYSLFLIDICNEQRKYLNRQSK